MLGDPIPKEELTPEALMELSGQAGAFFAQANNLTPEMTERKIANLDRVVLEYINSGTPEYAHLIIEAHIRKACLKKGIGQMPTLEQ